MLHQNGELKTGAEKRKSQSFSTKDFDNTLVKDINV